MKRIVILLASVALLAMPAAAHAAIINVDKTDDTLELGDSGCSLRNAFISADTDMQQAECEIGIGDDVIRMAAGTYRLDRLGAGESQGFIGDLDMLDEASITIEPASASAKVVIDGNGADRIFDHAASDLGALILRNIELTNGNPGAAADGGLIRNGNGVVRLEGVTLSGGVSGNGGAVQVLGSGRLEAVNSTFFGNRTQGNGGAIANDSGTTVDLRSVTIAGNEADVDGNGTGDGGGVMFKGNAAMTNSILANNTDSSPNPGERQNDCASGAQFLPRFVLSSQDLSAGSCLTGPDPGSNMDPVALGPTVLADNGGPTRTVEIQPGSPAVDTAGSSDPDKCPEKDQRGVPRPAGKCDLGAFEFDPEGVPPVPLPGLRAPSLSTAVFDGTRVSMLVKCPARFKPQCSSKLQVLKSKQGKAISTAAEVKIKPGKTRVVKVTVKSQFRSLVDGMTYVDKRSLAVSHQISSKKVGKRKTRKPTKLKLSLKVRIAG
ncbi:MAG: hypothetical protein KDB48_00970 [Solirubrobacterales bacterium]|nr:hypothetical protein [Solirubrobacterales bacterium]HMT04839.1 choice-of-anchor Q domain-containing protein [Solirubrobacterales bacterium]